MKIDTASRRRRDACARIEGQIMKRCARQSLNLSQAKTLTPVPDSLSDAAHIMRHKLAECSVLFGLAVEQNIMRIENDWNVHVLRVRKRVSWGID